MKLHLENGKTVTISADNNSKENCYIRSMKVNGKNHTRNYLTHEQLLNGANIRYVMDDTPNKQRGTEAADAPYSFSKE